MIFSLYIHFLKLNGILWLRSSRYEKDFCLCYQNYPRRLWLKYFICQISRRCCTPSYKSRGILDILAMRSRLNTLYELETLYAQASGHIKIMRKALRHLWRFYDVINVIFLRNFTVFVRQVSYSAFVKGHIQTSIKLVSFLFDCWKCVLATSIIDE